MSTIRVFTDPAMPKHVIYTFNFNNIKIITFIARCVVPKWWERLFIMPFLRERMAWDEEECDLIHIYKEWRGRKFLLWSER